MRDMAIVSQRRLMQWFCCLVLQQQLLARFVLRARSLLHTGAPLHDSRVGAIEMSCNQLVRSYTAHSCQCRHDGLREALSEGAVTEPSEA